MRCSKCGTENPVGKKFCGDCGAPLASICPRCASESPPGKQFCGDCGAALSGSGAAPPPTRTQPARSISVTSKRGTLLRRRILGVVLAFAIFSGLALLYFFLVKGKARAISPAVFVRTGATSIATLISSTASIFGMVDKRRLPPPTTSRLAPSFKSGLYGGVIGGALSGLIIGLVYYFDSRDLGVNWERIPIVFAFASAAGTLFGAFIQTGILVVSKIPTSRYVG
ncbi:MAG TPA: zinc ribbon domain-containing protein, partial [Candidatus Acidoferrales bacterium]|nr:zinc ribbon domain-containing protein [Candidatus Acidoferrales bacterium]